MDSASFDRPARFGLSDRAIIWLWAAGLTTLAGGLRLCWALAVPTVPVSDFAMYRESANYLSEFGALDPGFIYMPGFVVLLAWVKDLGGDLFAQKLLGVGFGALGAGGLYFLSAAVLDQGEPRGDAEGARWRRVCPRPQAALAAALYAVWPAGVAMSSVVGTDVPAAAVLVSALALLVTLGPRRPLAGALAFGATMGAAAWIRAVSLPLSALAFGYWLARGLPVRRALLYTAAGVGATLLVLAPWGLRHLRESGSLYFTDDHGGITALIGSNPNSEGTYTRALNQTFKNVTGRSVLDLPHREADRAAYAIAREWSAYEPRYTLGLAIKKAERLFDPERRLLYWPVFRPGVLIGSKADWFGARRAAMYALADLFAGVLVLLTLVGLVVAVARRRWVVLATVPFQLALMATYTTFFAEPRYRIPIEMLAFPFAALAVAETARLAGRARRDPQGALRRAAGVMGPAAVLVLIWRLGWPALVEKGEALRRRHRWVVTEGELDGRPRLVLWKPASKPGMPLPALSPLSGAFDDLRVRAGADGTAVARGVVGGGALAPGRYALEMSTRAEPGTAARVGLAGEEDVAAPEGPTVLRREVTHEGGRLVFELRVSAAPDQELRLGPPRLSKVP